MSIENLFNDLIEVVHQQQLERTWVCLSCGQLTQYWSTCEACEWPEHDNDA